MDTKIPDDITAAEIATPAALAALPLAAFEDAVLAPMRARFIGKTEIIDLIAVTAIAQENLLLLGPPGTAKSELITTFAANLDGRYFQYLLTKFTEPNEIFGPIDLNKLREGVVITNTEGMLPDAEFAFLDEVFNANSAILNSLLTILNERTFRRGKERLSLSLFAVYGATNIIPEDESLRALFDRFLLRVKSDNVGEAQLPSLFDLGWQLERARLSTANRLAADHQGQFSTSQLRQLSQAITAVDLSAVREPYLRLINQIRAAGIEVTDRRLVKLLRAIAAATLLRRQLKATIADLWVLRYIWSDDDQARVLAEIVQRELDQYLNEHPQEIVHALTRPFSPFNLIDLIGEFEKVRAQSEQIQTALDGDLLLAQLDKLTRKLEWLKPHNLDEQARQQTVLEQARSLATSIELKTT